MPRKKKLISDAYYDTFPQNLRTIMDKHNTTQQELSDILGFSRQMISQYCDGSSAPSWKTIVTIAKHFKVSTDWLLGIRDDPSNNTTEQDIHDITGLSSLAIKNLCGTHYYGNPIILDTINLLLEHEEMWQWLGKFRPFDEHRKEINLFWFISQYLFDTDYHNVFMIKLSDDTRYPLEKTELSGYEYITSGESLRALMDFSSIDTIIDKLKQLREKFVKPTNNQHRD